MSRGPCLVLVYNDALLSLMARAHLPGGACRAYNLQILLDVNGDVRIRISR